MIVTWQWVAVKALPEMPGVYRLIIGSRPYIGEAGSLTKRWRNYVKPGSTQTTAKRVKKLIDDLGLDRIDLMVHPLVNGAIVNMSSHLTRVMFETCAIHEEVIQGRHVHNLYRDH